MDLSDDFINDFDSEDFDPDPSPGKSRMPLIIGAAAFIILCCCCGSLYIFYQYIGDPLVELLKNTFS